ncbi:MAG: tyrosine-type recombinase/integrase [Chloroflexi bacterium]|nr:tyrosine-type recombinase/integrase [Chloroflexota bacterium]
MTLSTGKRRAHFKATIPTDPNLKPIGQWVPENRVFLVDFYAWLRAGGYAQSTIHQYGVSARLALGYLDKPCFEIDYHYDLEKVRVYLLSRPLSAATLACYQKGLNRLAHYLRKRKGIPDPEKMVNWEMYLRDIPTWLAADIRVYVAQRSRAWQADNRVQLTRNLLSTLGGFARFAKPASLQDITPKSWFAYLEERVKMGSKTSSNNTILWSLQSFLRFQQAAGQAICERMLAIRPQKTGIPKPRDLSIPDIKGLLQAAVGPLEQAWLILMVYTGLRTCEVRRLKWANVEVEHRCLRIEQSKNSEDRVVPLTQTVLDALETRGRSSEFAFSRHHLPLSRRYCQSRLTAIGKTCGVKATPHQLRHSAATLLLNMGMSVWGVKEILGHKSVETTLGYARTYDSTVAKDYYRAINQLS